MSAPNVKHLKVTVDAGSVRCSPERVTVKAADTLLVFTLETPGYVFPAIGAVAVGQPGSEFPYPSWMEHPRVVALFDRNSEARDFSYTVSAIDLTSGQTLSLDPTIRNEGHGVVDVRSGLNAAVAHAAC